MLIQRVATICCAIALLTSAARAESPPDFALKWGECGSAAGQTSHGNDVATNGAGRVYVADAENRRIQVFDVHGTYLFGWGSPGSGDGRFASPRGIALDSQGHVFVVDEFNYNVQKFDASGGFIKRWGSHGSSDGLFDGYPSRVAVDASGNVYVTEYPMGTGNHRVQKFDNDGNFLAKWGSHGSGPGQFDRPYGIAIDPADHVFVADWQNNRIQKFDTAGNFLSEWGTPGSGDGQFMSPLGVAVGPDGVYVTDQANHRIQKFDANGTFLSQWGSEGDGDGQFVYPLAVTTGQDGLVYVADGMTCRIQEFAYAATPTIRRSWGRLKLLYR